MRMTELIARLRREPECRVLPPAGMPSVDLPLPQDVAEFYRVCGGVMLYPEAPGGIDIVSPAEFVRANPVIALCDAEDDISHNWFILARSGVQYITIDLAPSRLGHCYDSFWDCHALVGSSTVIACSFESLLVQLMETRCEDWFWLREGFQSLGDAYDA